MADPREFIGGLWWRFDHYEIGDGRIQPVAGAQLSPYDPWESFCHDAPRKGTREAPYRTLLELVNNARYEIDPTGQRITPTPETESAILNWCTEHGLLGTLVHRVHAVTLAPRWAPFTSESLDDGSSREDAIRTQRQYLRTSTGWSDRTSTNLRPAADALVRHGKLVLGDDLPPRWPRPHVLIQELHTTRLEEEPLSKTWARHFPGVPEAERETAEYPMPFSKEFWHKYAEPLDAFIQAATALASAIKGLSHMKPFGEASEGDKRELIRGRDTLNALISPVSPGLTLLDSEIRQEWVSTSLLASFAMMALIDLTKGSIKECESCGTLYTTSAPRARYCSAKCRYREQKRRWRAKRDRTKPPDSKTGGAS